MTLTQNRQRALFLLEPPLAGAERGRADPALRSILTEHIGPKTLRTTMTGR